MSSPTTDLTSVTIHAAPGRDIITGDDAKAMFEGREITVMKARPVATDGQGNSTFTDVEIRAAPRKKSCCSCICSGKLGTVIRSVSYLAVGVIGYGICYFQETYK